MWFKDRHFLVIGGIFLAIVSLYFQTTSWGVVALALIVLGTFCMKVD